MWRHLESSLTSCGLPQITWYEATKHTFASHYLMNGGRIERLATILGHTDTEVTRRYGHLRVDLFPDEEFRAVGLNRASGTASSTNGPTRQGRRGRKKSNWQRKFSDLRP
jgi:hypothetical protein